MSDTNSPSPWKGRLTEGLVIVVSILLAFGIDAWWDESREQRETRELVEALEPELSDMLAQIELVGDSADLRTEWAAWLQNATPAEIQEMSETDAWARFLRLTAPKTFDPGAGGALTSIFEAGAIDRIEENELRAAITAIPPLLDDIAEEREFLTENMYRLQGRMAEIGLASSSLLIFTGEESAVAGLEQMRADPLMRELIATAGLLSWVLSEELGRLGAHIARTLELVRAN